MALSGIVEIEYGRARGSDDSNDTSNTNSRGLILFFEMKDRLYDVWARTHTLGGRGPKRLVTTFRVTHWEDAQQVWGVAKR